MTRQQRHYETLYDAVKGKIKRATTSSRPQELETQSLLLNTQPAGNPLAID